MALKLYWDGRDFDDPLMGLIDALDDMAGQAPKIYYDYYGAETPEGAELPISYWSKERIMFYLRESKLIKREVIPVLERFRLDDLRAVALMRVGKRPTGNLRDMRPREKGEWRNTTYWSLDVESINSII